MNQSKLNDPIFYLAPMLGITDACFRSAFMKYFGGFDCGISPFVRTLQGERYKESAFKDLLRHQETSLELFPQVLTNDPSDFIKLAKDLCDAGFSKINLNMGCPVPTAAGKGRGAGLLPEIDYVDQLLDKVLSQIPNKLSIKTRIGLDSEDDLLKMSKVFDRYPLYEIIVHPRTAKQKYGGSVNHEVFDVFCEESKHQIVYSGDIFSVDEFSEIQARHPQINRWMLGRGILKNPFLMQEIRGNQEPGTKVIREFLVSLSKLYAERDLSDHIIMTRIKVLLLYLGIGHGFPKKTVKALRKARDLDTVFAYLPF